MRFFERVFPVPLRLDKLAIQIAVDRTEGRVESRRPSRRQSPDPNTKDPWRESVSAVVPKDIVGARFVSQGDTRILERVAA